MGRDVLASALEVVAELGDQVERISELGGGVKPAVDHAVVDSVRMSRDVRDQRNNRLLELGENRLELVGGQSRLVPVQQRVVGALGISEGVGDLAVQLDVFLEGGSEDLEVGLTPRLLPQGPRR